MQMGRHSDISTLNSLICTSVLYTTYIPQINNSDSLTRLYKVKRDRYVFLI